MPSGNRGTACPDEPPTRQINPQCVAHQVGDPDGRIDAVPYASLAGKKLDAWCMIATTRIEKLTFTAFGFSYPQPRFCMPRTIALCVFSYRHIELVLHKEQRCIIVLRQDHRRREQQVA